MTYEEGFNKFTKIYRVGTVDALDLTLEKVDFEMEKLDGFNTSIWKNEDASEHIGKRNSEISFESGGQFQQFAKWVKEKNWSFLPKHFRLHGEGLQCGEISPGKFKNSGKIKYERTTPFVLFAIMYKDTWIKPESEEWNNILKGFEEMNKEPLPVAPILRRNIRTSLQEIDDGLKENPKSVYSPDVNMEGVVLSKYNDDGTAEFCKVVSDEFAEIKVKGNPKGSNYDELATSVVTINRVRKIMRDNEITDITKLGMLIGKTAEDVFSEEEDLLKEHAWKLFKKRMGRSIPSVVKHHFGEVMKELEEDNDKTQIR